MVLILLASMKAFPCLLQQSQSCGICRGMKSFMTYLHEHFCTDLLFCFASLQAMCGHQDPEDLQSSLDTDPHSPLPLRVYGPISNNQDFVKHFHCPRRSPMNPDSKCHIW